MRYVHILRRDTHIVEETKIAVDAPNGMQAIAKIQAILDRNGLDWQRKSHTHEYAWLSEPDLYKDVPGVIRNEEEEETDNA